MGLFDQGNESNDLMDQQIRQNQAELEEKRQNLYRERLDIIKSQGAQSFTPDNAAIQDVKPREPINPYAGYDFSKMLRKNR